MRVTGQNGSSRHAVASFDSSSRRISEQSSGLLIRLAALLHRLPRYVLKRLRPVVRPDTVLRWHRDMLARRQARRSRPRCPGRPRTVRSIRVLALRYRRVHGELLVLGVKVAASTVWEILHEAGIDPAPGRSSATLVDFLRSQAEALLACDFFHRGQPGQSGLEGGLPTHAQRPWHRHPGVFRLPAVRLGPRPR
jgi:hypothetical protein